MTDGRHMVPVRPGIREIVSAYADIDLAWAFVYAGLACSGRLGGVVLNVLSCIGCGTFLVFWWGNMHRKPGFRPMDVRWRKRR